MRLAPPAVSRCWRSIRERVTLQQVTLQRESERATTAARHADAGGPGKKYRTMRAEVTSDGIRPDSGPHQCA